MNEQAKSVYMNTTRKNYKMSADEKKTQKGG